MKTKTKNAEEIEYIIVRLHEELNSTIKKCLELKKSKEECGQIVGKHVRNFLLKRNNCSSHEACFILSALIITFYIDDTYPDNIN